MWENGILPIILIYSVHRSLKMYLTRKSPLKKEYFHTLTYFNPTSTTVRIGAYTCTNKNRYEL